MYYQNGDGFWTYSDGGSDYLDGAYFDLYGDDVWHYLAQGVDFALAEGVAYNIHGDNKAYIYSSGIRVLYDGLANVQGDNKLRLYTSGVGALFTGNSNVSSDGYWRVFTAGVQGAKIVGSRSDLIGDGLWYYFSITTPDTVLLNGLFSGLSGLTGWQVLTDGVAAQADGLLVNSNSIGGGDGKRHRYNAGVDSGLFTGVSNVSSDGYWRTFTAGVEGAKFAGDSASVVGDGLWYHFSSTTPDAVLLNGLFSGLSGLTGWQVLTDGVAAQADGVLVNSNSIGGGDGKRHRYNAGVDSGLFTGVSNVSSDGYWRTFTAGVEGAKFAGDSASIVGDGLWYHFSSTTPDAVFLNGPFLNLGGVSGWQILTDGAAAVADGVYYYSNSLGAGDGKYHQYNAGVDAGLFTGTIPHPWIWWKRTYIASGVDIGEPDGWVLDVGAWEHYSSGEHDGTADGVLLNVTGDGKWHSFTASGVDEGLYNGYSNTVIGDSLWHGFTAGVAVLLNGTFDVGSGSQFFVNGVVGASGIVLPVVPKNGVGVPASGSLVSGEIAADWVNGRLFLKLQGGAVVEVSVSPASIAAAIATATASVQSVLAATDAASAKRAAGLSMIL